MRNIRDEETDRILADLERAGIELEDLRMNLLDHICCLLETEMEEGDDFETHYQSVLRRFYQKELAEIQQETDALLTFKHYYAMKNTLKISGMIAGALTLLGAMLKTFHLPGANASMLLGGALFSLLFLPLMIVLKFRDEEKTTDKLVLSMGLLIGMFAFVGIQFKLLHWPYANFLMRWSTTAFIFGYIPLYFITRIRRPELRFNTIVNSVLMMACGGMLYGLYNLKSTQEINEKLMAGQVYLDGSVDILRASNEVAFQNPEVSRSPYVESARQTLTFLDSCKIHLIMILEQMPEDQAARFNITDLNSPLDTDRTGMFFQNPEQPFGAVPLMKELTRYNEKVVELFGPETEKRLPIEALNFHQVQALTALQQLTQMEWQIQSSLNAWLMQSRISQNP